MEVQLFIQQDTQELIYDGEKLDEWKKQIEELELEGQKDLCSGEKSPIPFLFMKKPMIRMFEILCPEKVRVNKYDKSPIPMEALGAIALAQREEHFHKIEIWYDDKDPDPIAVGYKDDSYSSDKYLIARWGAEKADMEELKTQATMRFMDQKKTELEEKIQDCKTNLEKIDILARKHMNGEYVSWP